MAWTDGPLVVYHGTDDFAALAILLNGIEISRSFPFSDFGRGFYTTTSFWQAQNWANRRCRRIPAAAAGSVSRGAVMEFRIDRAALDPLCSLVFILEGSNSDYWDFVEHNRYGRGPHRPSTNGTYDVVFGPVSLWEQRLVIANCDQISFHTPASVSPLQHVATHTPSGGIFFDP